MVDDFILIFFAGRKYLWDQGFKRETRASVQSSQRSIENIAEKYHFFYSDQSQVVFPGQETGMEAGLGCSHAQNQGVDGQAVSQELRVRLFWRAGLRVHRKVPSADTQKLNEGSGATGVLRKHREDGYSIFSYFSLRNSNIVLSTAEMIWYWLSFF